MPSTIELYQTEFNSNLLTRYQQSKSRLSEFVTVEDFDGERKDFPRINPAPAPTNLGAPSAIARNQATPYREVDFDKRWVYPTAWELPSHFEQWDVKFLAKIALPNSAVQVEHNKSFYRQFDDEIIKSALGNVMSGKLGTTTNALPASQKIAAGGTGMTLAKLLATLDILDGADNLDDENMERVFVWTVKQRSELLNTTEVKSADYNTVKALAEGKIDSFMGFKFKLLKRLPLATPGAGGVRSCVAFCRNTLVATRHLKPTTVTIRDDRRNALQVYSTGLTGGARLHDEGVVQIDCADTTPASGNEIVIS